ncbi:MAG: hypothetical protein M0037_13330 [Betaproteobacteria bacterium]|nr:hypothetical protein [Betaproteobacteria bacterium]
MVMDLDNAQKRAGANGVAPPRTRLLALGSAALTDGFALIGFETVPEATPRQLEELLAGLVTSRQNALVIIGQDLGLSDGPWLKRVRDKGGRIVLAEIPPLDAPGSHRLPVEDLIKSVLGPGALGGPT